MRKQSFWKNGELKSAEIRGGEHIFYKGTADLLPSSGRGKEKQVNTGNYIILLRRILEWEWYSDINTTRLFIHMLCRANWKDGYFKGEKIERGSFVSSIGKLAQETNLTEREVRTALKHLKTTGEVTSRTTSKYSVFTVKNYNRYQSGDKQNDRQVTGERQASDKQVTTIEEGNKGRREERNKNKYTCAFEEFWKSYPRKVDKGNAYKAFEARIHAGYAEDELILACKNYADVCRKEQTDTKYIKHAKTFLSANTPFLDYLRTESEGNDDTGGKAGADETSITEQAFRAGLGTEFGGF